MKNSILFIMLFSSIHGIAQTPKNKPASSHTKQLNNQVLQQLNFTNQSDYEDANKGLIAKYPEGTIGKFYSFE